MREHPLRTSFTVAGIALGVSVLVAVALLSSSIERGVAASVDNLAGKADLQVRAGALGFDEALIETVRRVPGVYKVAPLVQQIVTLRTAGGRRERLLVIGVDMLGNDDAYFRSYESPALDAIRQDPLAFLNSPSHIVLSRSLAQRAGVRLHDQVAIGTGTALQRFEVWGFSEDGAAVNRAFGGAIGVMYFTAMQVAFGRGRNIDSIDVAVQPGRDPEAVARGLRAALGGAFAVERPGLRGERISKMLAAMRTGFTMSSLIAMLTASFLAFNTVSISIAQRARELGILRALGMTRRQQLGMLTLEGTVLGGAGSALGILGGMALAHGMLELTHRAVDALYLQQSVTEVRPDVAVFASGFAVGTVFATLAAFVAAWRVRRLRPISAFAAAAPPASSSAGARPWRSQLAGVGFVAATLLLLALPSAGSLPHAAVAACATLLLAGRLAMPWFVQVVHFFVARGARGVLGVETALANDNMKRELDRSSSSAAGLMAGVALTVGIATFATSFFESLETWTAQVAPGDLFVTSGARLGALSSKNTPMADSFRDELLALADVERVRRMRFVDGEYRGFPVKLGATDIREFVKRSRLTLLEGRLEQVVEELAAGSVVVSENFAQRFDVHRGSKIALNAPEGGTREFSVAGVIVDYTSDIGAVTFDWPTFAAHWRDGRVDTYELHVRAGASSAAVRDAINERWGESRDLFVLTNREFRGEITKVVEGIFTLIRILESVSLLVASLGIVSSVLTNVLDRVREIGVLRAIGMLRRQLQAVVVAEAVLLGSVGAVAGVAVGLGLGYIILRHVLGAQTGWHLSYHVPARTIAELALWVVPISALAGFVPARRAGALAVADALDYE